MIIKIVPFLSENRYIDAISNNRGYNMNLDYEMITVNDFFDLTNIRYLTINENEIKAKVKRYLLNLKRYETNEKIVESLLT